MKVFITNMFVFLLFVVIVTSIPYTVHAVAHVSATPCALCGPPDPPINLIIVSSVVERQTMDTAESTVRAKKDK